MNLERFWSAMYMSELWHATYICYRYWPARYRRNAHACRAKAMVVFDRIMDGREAAKP